MQWRTGFVCHDAMWLAMYDFGTQTLTAWKQLLVSNSPILIKPEVHILFMGKP